MTDFSLLMQPPALWLVALNTLLHEIGVPLPLTPTVLVAGAASVTAGAHPLVLIGVIVVAMVAGNAAWFAAGRRYGSGVLKLLCRLSLSPDTCVRQTEDAFGRWGGSSLILGRFIPGISLVAPPLAGALGMTWSRFIVLSTVSAAIWATAAVGAGMLLHAQVETLVHAAAGFGFEALATVIVLLAAYIAWRWVQRLRAARRLEMPRITVPELKALMDRGSAPVVIDVRGASTRQLDARRIPTAITIDLDALPDLPREREIVLYCNCPSEASAAHVARLLHERGYKRARPLRDGLDGWIEAGYLVEADERPARAVVPALSSRSA